MSKEQFDKCLGDEALFKKIVDTRTKGNDKFQVDSTPTFFVNGTRHKGDHQTSDFQAAFGETPAAGDAKPDDAKPDDAKTGDAKTGDT
jgi:protein-disulfide isomerase